MRGLVVSLLPVALEDGKGDFTVDGVEASDVSGEAMHVVGLAAIGKGHELLSALPVEVLGVVSKALLLESSELGLRVFLTEELDATLHDVERSP